MAKAAPKSARTPHNKPAPRVKPKVKPAIKPKGPKRASTVKKAITKPAPKASKKSTKAPTKPVAAKYQPPKKPRVARAMTKAQTAAPLLSDATTRGKPIDTDKSYAFAVEAARLASDDKCEDVVLLDVRNLSSVTDFIIIGSGTSDRQMRSVLSHIEDLGKEQGNAVHRVSADDRATWLIADFVDVVVHLFEPGARAHYDLEMMWGDAKKIAWERAPGSNPRARKPVGV